MKEIECLQNREELVYRNKIHFSLIRYSSHDVINMKLKKYSVFL